VIAMRVAALFDLHGNLPALEAVLDGIRRESVDAILIGGDVLPGPMPRETIAALRSLAIPVHGISGNGEREVLASRGGRPLATVPQAFHHLIHWTARQLRPDDEQWLASWPLTTRLSIAGVGDVLFCHATPRNDYEIFTKRTPEERLRPLFDGRGVPLVVCGHTHMPFDRMIGATRVVNAGSVGMPFGAAGADWLLIGPGVEFRHTAYDLAAAADRIRATAYPQAREFADTNVLNPPSEDAMLEAFTRASL
jgi:predicted phosphodiesterase